MNAFYMLAVFYSLLSGFFYREWRVGLKQDLEFKGMNLGFAALAWRHLKVNVIFTIACLLLGTLVHFTTE